MQVDILRDQFEIKQQAAALKIASLEQELKLQQKSCLEHQSFSTAVFQYLTSTRKTTKYINYNLD